MAKIRVIATLRGEILDPQGAAVTVALQAVGCGAVKNVRQGVVFDLDVDGDDPMAEVKQACEKLLVNPILYDYEIVK